MKIGQGGDIEFRVRVDAECGKDGGKEILLIVGLTGDLEAKFVSGSHYRSFGNPASEHGEAPRIGVVVPTPGSV